MVGYLINGVAAGGGYALLAVGLSFTIGISRVFNFAFGGFYTVAAFTAAWLIANGISGGYYGAIIVTLAVIAAVGIIFACVAVLPVIKYSMDAVMVATLAAGIAITNLAQAVFGTQVKVLPSPLEFPKFHIDNATFSPQSLVLVAAGPFVALVLTAFLRRTILGTRIRAVAINPELAAVTGVRTTATFAGAVVIGVTLAALSGVLTAPESIIDISSGDKVLLGAFTVAALAGMGHLWGAVYVGFGLGIVESLFSAYVSSAYAPAFVYIVLIATLIFRPKGILGGH